MRLPDTRLDQPSYTWYVVILLFIVNLFNFIDRNVLNVLVEPIKAEFGLSDTQIGFLTGPAFAFIYAICGIPIARWADRSARRTVISLSIGAWSFMTAASGLATGFWSLAAARIGVGVGEAGGTPPSHSLISDYVPLAKRGFALAIQGSGTYVGVLFGMFLGGLIAEQVGWRGAFFALGLPGILLALIVRFTIAEPPRGRFDKKQEESNLPGLGETLRYLLSVPSYRWLQISGSMSGLVFASFVVWGPALLSRTQGASLVEAGTTVGLSNALGGLAGSLLGGHLIDRFGSKDRRWYGWLPATAMFISIPCYLLFLFLPPGVPAVLAYATATAMAGLTGTAVWAISQGIAPARMRALSTAITIFAANLIGAGLGPQLGGILSDFLRPTYGSESIRWALFYLTFINLFVASGNLLIARTIRKDFAAS